MESVIAIANLLAALVALAAAWLSFPFLKKV
jgi:hypothetical protein